MMEKLNTTMATVSILVFLDWKKEFHVHFKTLFVTLGIFLTQLGEGVPDHPISFISRKP